MRGSPALADRASDATPPLATWLLQNAQVGDAYAAGGVAGWLQSDRTPAFVYPEITGYWLTWLAWRASEAEPAERARLARSAEAAVCFLAAWAEQRPFPAPRLYPPGRKGDWRQRAVFSFDLAMALRGLRHAAALVDPGVCRAAAAALGPWLRRMTSDAGLEACLPTGQALPERWSTRPGPYQAKAAAAILLAGEDYACAGLREAAGRTLDRFRGRAEEEAEPHPRLYALEGDALVQGGVTAQAAALAAATPASARSDVLAQALRILALAGAPEPASTRLADALVRRVQPDGAVVFDAVTPHANVWAAMFADQALRWLADARCGHAANTHLLV